MTFVYSCRYRKRTCMTICTDVTLCDLGDTDLCNPKERKILQCPGCPSRPENERAVAAYCKLPGISELSRWFFYVFEICISNITVFIHDPMMIQWYHIHSSLAGNSRSRWPKLLRMACGESCSEQAQERFVAKHHELNEFLDARVWTNFRLLHFSNLWLWIFFVS